MFFTFFDQPKFNDVVLVWRGNLDLVVVRRPDDNQPGVRVVFQSIQKSFDGNGIALVL